MKADFKIRLLYLVIPSIILFLFFKNLYFTEKYKMDSWLGGGMRMFSSIDHSEIRLIGFYTTIEDSVYFVNLKKNGNLYEQSLKTRILPNDKRMSELTLKIQEQKWCLDSLGNLALCNISGTGKKIDIEVDRLSIYRIKYKTTDKKLNLEVLKEYIPR